MLFRSYRPLRERLRHSFRRAARRWWRCASRPRRHRRNLRPGGAPASLGLELGGRAAPLAGAILAAGLLAAGLAGLGPGSSPPPGFSPFQLAGSRARARAEVKTQVD